MKNVNVSEVRETRSVETVNEALRVGGHLLEINTTSRGPIYILGTNTHTLEAGRSVSLPSLPE